MPPTISKHINLTVDEAVQLGNALARLEELRDTPATLSIVKPDGENANTETLTRDAEIAALVEHLAQKLLAHAGELVGCFLAVQTEYSPLVRAFAPIVQRLSLVRPLKDPEVQDPTKN